jgi:hypothetical protein
MVRSREGVIKLKKRKIQVGLSVFLTLLLGVAGLVRPTSAEPDLDGEIWLRVSPTINNINLDPGQEFSDKIVVSNASASPLNFRVYASPYGVRDLTYEPFYEGGSVYNQIVQWVTFDKSDYTELAPGQSIEVPYQIQVPANAPGGSQHAVIFVETANQHMVSDSQDNTLHTISRIGTLVSAVVSGETRGYGSVQSINQPALLTGEPINSQIIFKNTGNVDLDVHYIHTVGNLFGGRAICTAEQQQRVAPETSRQVDLACEDSSPTLGLFKVTNVASFTGFMGNVKYDKSSLVLIAPWWLLVILGLLLAAGVTLATRAIMRQIRLKKRKVRVV